MSQKKHVPVRTPHDELAREAEEWDSGMRTPKGFSDALEATPPMRRVLHSEIDESVNWITDAEVGFWEARYVSRDRHDIVYLSAQSGCKWGCKFCHLTATKQTRYVNASHAEIVNQARPIVDHLTRTTQKDLVHFNFMARGEPLDNPAVNSGLLKDLSSLTPRYSKFLVSTIMPKFVDFDHLKDRFRGTLPELYYSLYSMDEEFRSRWLPGAGDPHKALDTLKQWQDLTNKIPKIHFAFIRGENDSKGSVKRIVRELEQRKLACTVNIVRYNPPDSKSQESPERAIDAARYILRDCPYVLRLDVVPRVGYDVKASCGMFVK